jgi:hypothetical protein
MESNSTALVGSCLLPAHVEQANPRLVRNLAALHQVRHRPRLDLEVGAEPGRGPQSHSRTTLYISIGIIYKKDAGVRDNGSMAPG